MKIKVTENIFYLVFQLAKGQNLLGYCHYMEILFHIYLFIYLFFFIHRNLNSLPVTAEDGNLLKPVTEWLSD